MRLALSPIDPNPSINSTLSTLKRAALGLLRMMIESKSQLDLFGLIKQSVKLYEFDEEIIQDIYDFMPITPCKSANSPTISVIKSVFDNSPARALCFVFAPIISAI
jgi:glycyl-tRNA synthetase beta subunit